MCRRDAILLCVRGSTTGRTNRADQPYAIGRGVAAIEAEDLDDQSYLYYALLARLGRLLERTTGSVFPNLSQADVGSLLVPWLPPDSRRAIAEVLGALDDKIDANQRTVALLREVASTLYRQGVQEEPDVETVGDVATFHNRLRVPLSSRDRSTRPGPFAYHGAAGVLDHVDSYLFGGIYLLVGEDGTVISNDRHPMLQYVWGKFWVSNHAHVLTGSRISTELLRVALGSVDITAVVTGAVQPKLSMGNLKAVALTLPMRREMLEVRLAELAAHERSLGAEHRLLTRTRDALLPKLLSGDVRVRDAEDLVGEAV